jgi:hypothetical protein
MRRRRFELKRVLGIGCLVVVIGFILWIGVGFLASAQCVRFSAQDPPTPKDAPFVVTTDSRVYYVSEYTETPEDIILLKFYSFHDGKWEKFDDVPLRLYKPVYRNIKITKR